MTDLDNPEFNLKEIGGLLGAFDGKIVDRVRRIIQYHTISCWEVDRLSKLMEHSNREYAVKTMKEVLDKAQVEREKISKSLGIAT